MTTRTTSTIWTMETIEEYVDIRKVHSNII